MWHTEKPRTSRKHTVLGEDGCERIVPAIVLELVVEQQDNLAVSQARVGHQQQHTMRARRALAGAGEGRPVAVAW